MGAINLRSSVNSVALILETHSINSTLMVDSLFEGLCVCSGVFQQTRQAPFLQKTIWTVRIPRAGVQVRHMPRR